MPQKILRDYDLNEIDFINAEEASSFITMIRKAKNGSQIFMYLDGNTGPENDKNSISINLGFSKIKVRTGLVKIASLLDAVIYPIFIEGSVQKGFQIAKSMTIDIRDFAFQKKKPKTEAILQNIYNQFHYHLSKAPISWEVWNDFERMISSEDYQDIQGSSDGIKYDNKRMCLLKHRKKTNISYLISYRTGILN